eukprot:1126115-Pelagomonas_calceolata.AAC.3
MSKLTDAHQPCALVSSVCSHLPVPSLTAGPVLQNVPGPAVVLMLWASHPCVTQTVRVIHLQAKVRRVLSVIRKLYHLWHTVRILCGACFTHLTPGMPPCAPSVPVGRVAARWSEQRTEKATIKFHCPSKSCAVSRIHIHAQQVPHLKENLHSQVFVHIGRRAPETGLPPAAWLGADLRMHGRVHRCMHCVGAITLHFQIRFALLQPRA